MEAVMNFVDQRQAQRFDAAVAVRVVRGEEDATGVTQNVSLGGARISVRLNPPAVVGERMKIFLQLPTLEAPIEVEAEVRWKAGDDGALGIKFTTGLRAKETWALTRFLERATPSP